MNDTFAAKLKTLRSEKSLSQEELAEILCVSRTAVSKWESGRGLPNLDALTKIAEYFNVTVDFLLSAKEAIEKSETQKKDEKQKSRLMISGLLDCLIILLVILPLFPFSSENHILTVPIFKSDLSLVTKALYLGLFFLSLATGILQLILMSFPEKTKAIKSASLISTGLGILLLLVVIITPNAYAGLFIFVLQILKFISSRM